MDMEIYKITALGPAGLLFVVVPLVAAVLVILPVLADLFKKKEEGPAKEYRDLVPKPEVLLSKEAGFLLVERCRDDCPQSSYLQVFDKRFEDPASIAAAANDVEELRSRGHGPFVSHRFLREPPSKEVFNNLLAQYEGRLFVWKRNQQGKEDFRFSPRPMPPCDFTRTTFVGDEV